MSMQFLKMKLFIPAPISGCFNMTGTAQTGVDTDPGRFAEAAALQMKGVQTLRRRAERSGDRKRVDGPGGAANVEALSQAICSLNPEAQICSK